MNNDKKIQSSAKEKSLVKRCLALLTCVGMLGSFMMPYQDLSIAIAVDDGYIEDETFPEYDEQLDLSAYTPASASILSKAINSGGWFEGSAQETAMGVSLYTKDENGNVTVNHITKVDVSLKEIDTSGKEVYKAYSGGEVSGDLAELRIDMTYSFDSASSVVNDPDHCVYFNLAESSNPSDVLKIKQPYFGSNQKVTDAEYSTTKPSGYFSIATNGMIVIHFTDDYINYLKGKNGFQGTINFKAQVDKGDSADGDKTVNVAGTEINVNFANDKFTNEKKGIIGKKEDGTKYIDWTITIKNPNGHINLKDGYTVTDVLKVGDAESNLDFSSLNPTITAKDRDGNSMTVTANVDATDKNKLTFNYDYATVTNGDTEHPEKTGNPAEVKITYRQEGVENGVLNDNTATMGGGDSKYLPQNAANDKQTVANQFSISKTGIPDYQLGATAEDKVQWTIEVENKSGDSLSGAKVTEDATLGIDFPTGTKVYDKDNNDITSQCTISGKTITFGTGVTTSVAKIVYEQAGVFLTASDTGLTDNIPYAKLKNKASISSEKEGSPPPSDTGEKEVTYKRQLRTEKEGSYNQEQKTIQWKIKVYANKAEYWGVDSNSLTSLNGYTLEDTAFAKFTIENEDGSLSATDGSKLTFNVQHNNASASSPAALKTTGNANIKKIECGDDVNYIELFYTVPLTSEELATMDTNGTVKVENTATAYRADNGYSHGITGGVDCNARHSVTKDYTGSEQDTVTIGSTYDNRERMLDWRVEMTKDTGFGDGAVSVTDVLQVSDGEDVTKLHYIKPSQAKDIKLYPKVYSANSSTTPLDNQYYDIVFKDGNGNSIANFASQTDDAEGTVNAVSFEITFKDDANKTLESYRYMDLVYATTANIKNVEQGHTVEFKNTSTFGNDSDTKTSFTFQRKSATEPDKTKLSVKKIWDDNQNAYGFRPDTIQVKVLRALANDDGTAVAEGASWEYVKDENDAEKIYTLRVSSVNGEDTILIDDEFDEWCTNQDGTITRYVYKIEELSVANYEVTQDSNMIYADGVYDNNQTSEILSIKNKLNASNVYGKSALNSNNQVITEQDYNSLTKAKMTIDGKETEVVLIRWKLSFDLEYDENTKSDLVTFTDTLPKGAIYLSEGSIQVFDAWNTWSQDVTPYVVYKDSTGNWRNFNTDKKSNDEYAVLNSAGNQISMQFVKEVDSFYYYTAIPVDDFASSLKNGVLINKIKLNQAGEISHEGKLTINNPPEVQLIDKNSITSDVPGYLNYSLDINPNGAQLSNDGTVDIVDVLNVTSGDGSNLSYSLHEVKVYPYNGKTVSNTPLAGNEYTVIPECNIAEQVPVEYSFTKGNTAFSTKNMQVGDRVTITIQGVPNHQFTNLNIYTNGWDGKENRAGFVNLGGTTLDANGLFTCQYTVVSGTEELFIDAWDGDNGKISSVTATVSNREQSVVTPAKLTLTVPDKQHLYVEYTYKVTGWTESTNVSFRNTASIDSDYASASDTVNDYTLNVNEAGATSTALTFPSIYKVDVGNYAMNTLNARFKVAKLINGGWVYANTITKQHITNGDSDGDARKFTFDNLALTEANDKPPANAAVLSLNQADDEATADDEAMHDFYLDSGALYKFVEITAPSGYNQPDWTNGTLTSNAAFVFYYLYGSYDATSGGTIPTGVTYDTILDKGKIEIPNNKTINVSVSKMFSGTNLPNSESVSSVTFKLYRSTSKTGVQTEVENSAQTINYPTTTNYTWTNLPSGYEGKAYYYFVRETSYTDGGNTYVYDETDKKYYLQNGNTVDKNHEGRFKPVYSNNGTNVTGTVSVNNSEGIIVRKLWVDRNGRTITPPNDVNSTSAMAIRFQITATASDGTETILELPDDAVLNAANQYQYVVPVSLTQDYVSFVVEEALTTSQSDLLLERNFSDEPDVDYSISNGAGLVTITNTDESLLLTNAEVEKVWNDSESSHSDINVKLIQTTEQKTAEQLENLSASEFTSISGNSAVMVLAPSGTGTYTLDSSKTYSSYTITPANSGITATKNDTTISVLAGSSETSGKLKVDYTDGTSDEMTISVINQVATLSGSNLTKNWSNLPYSGSNGRYYYYVLETSDITGYSAGYALNVTEENQKTVITNSKSTKLVVTKAWNNNVPTEYQNPVTVKLQYKIGDNGNWADYDTPAITLNSSSWTGNFSDLPKKDDNNNTYHYKVVETKVGNSNGLNAFTVAYDSEDVTFGDSDSQKTIGITNTLRTMQLKVIKDWADKDTKEHSSDTVPVLLDRSIDSNDALSVTLIDDSQPETKNPFPYYNNENNLPSTLNKGDKVTITFSYTGEGTPSINGCLGGNGVDSNGNDTNWDTQGWSATIGNDGTATAEIALDRVIKNPQIQLWWVDGYSKMKEGSTTERADDDKTDYAPLSITSVTYTQKPQKTLNLTVDYQNSKTIEVDGTATLSPSWSDSSSVDSVEYEFSTDNSTWNNSSSVVSISGNTLTGATAGAVYVRAKSEDVYSSSVQVTVNAKPVYKTYEIVQNISVGDEDVIVNLEQDKIAKKFELFFDKDAIGDAYHQLITLWNVQYSWGAGTSNNYAAVQGLDSLLIDTGAGSNITTSMTFRKGQYQSDTSVVITKIIVYYEDVSTAHQFPHRPTRSLPRIATPTDSTQYVLRLGNLVQAQQSAESQNTSISQVVTGTPKMRRMQANAASWQNVTLTSNGNWSEEITLPMYDTNGNKYYYWLAENSVPAGYTASYKFEGGGNSYCIDATATNPQITVKNTPLTEGSVDLPTSGGSGTAPYRTAGFLLMMTAVTFPYIKHRNRRKRNSA